MQNFNIMKSNVFLIFCFLFILSSVLYGHDTQDHDHLNDDTERHYDLYDRTVDNADFNPYDYPVKPKQRHNNHHMVYYYQDPDFEGVTPTNNVQNNQSNVEQSYNQNQNPNGQYQR